MRLFSHKFAGLRNLISNSKIRNSKDIAVIPAKAGIQSGFQVKLGMTLFIILLFSTLSNASENLLKNGDFEAGLANNIPKFWGTEYYNCSLVTGRDGGNAIKIENTKPIMSLGAQEIPIDWKTTPKVSFSMWVKAENISAGVEDWNKANAQLLFFDAKDAQVGGWPELGKWTGSFAWTKYAKNFEVPKGAVKAKVVFGLFNNNGTIFFDDIVLIPLLETKSTDPYNLLENGGFEIWEKWAYGGSTDWGIVFGNIKEGNGALRINNTVPVWSFASQSVPLDSTKISKIKLSGFIKANNIVPGVKPWQLARVNIEFKDGKGKRIGGWPILDAFSGTFDWKQVEQTFDVPAGTKRVDVFAGLLECAGEAFFDGLRLEGFDKSGKAVQIGGYKVTDTKAWYPFTPKEDTFDKTITDVSFLLDAPAGKHGFMKSKNGHFYFEDGTRARFWGTNIYAPHTFLSKPDAERMAARLEKNGCNLVRIHHIDAFWANPNIFDQSFNDTVHISAEAMDKLDYLIYQLKQKGIYVFMDLLVDREFKEGDGVADYKNVERGAKISGLFNRRIIELQKLYAKQILTHVNPYTGLSYVNDPVVVSAKLINEAMMFYIGTQFGLSKYYLAELDSKFNSWLASKYGGRDGLAAAWTDRYGRSDIAADEDPRRGNVTRADIPLKYQRSGGEKREPFRLADTLKFYEQIQMDYFNEMEGYLKSLGLKVPISGSNHWVNVAVDVKTNASLDYIDRHRYWDHPQFGYGTKVVFENQSMLKTPSEALPNNFAFYKVKDKPFVISEWNTCFPDEFRAEGPMLMAAYACLQDWDGVLQFSFNHPDWTAPMEDNFDISAWPNVLSQWPAAAMMFYRGDVSQAKNTINQYVGEKDLYGPINEDQPIFNDPYLPLISKTSISFKNSNEDVNPTDSTTAHHDAANKTISSDTNQLKWNYKNGIFLINTDKTQAVIGFFKDKAIELKDVTIKSSTPFCSIVLSSTGVSPISSASKLLLSASSRIENKNQRYNESKTQLENVGTAPLLVEGVAAIVSMKKAPKKVLALDINGKKIQEIAVKGKSFNIKPSDKAFFYEIAY